MENNNTFEKIEPECDEFGIKEPMMLGNLLDSLDIHEEDSKRIKLDLKLETRKKNETFYRGILRNIKN